MTHVILDLDVEGSPVDPTTGTSVRDLSVPGFLERHLLVPASTTDIAVFVHGWRNTPATALKRAKQFIKLVDNLYRTRPHHYPALHDWGCHYVVVRWPSSSNPFLTGYRRIRDRAHLMSTRGHAAQVLAQLLGYLNSHRTHPSSTLRTQSGQYLHLIGHSFGCRFLAEAVQWAAEHRPDVLGWDRANLRYPYAVDTVLLFQMALPYNTLTQRFPRLVHDAPVKGPVVLTHATTDRAAGFWHSMAEGVPGIGFRGASDLGADVTSLKLRPVHATYTTEDFRSTVVNVDASWRFRRGRLLWPAGAHADIFHTESAHLLLSLAQLAR
jgi:esterase/lipase superfamily enzyme